MSDMVSVLVLYNAPRGAGMQSQQEAWSESDSGVMEELRAVSAALERLGIPHEYVGIRRLQELPVILAESAATVVFNLVESLEGGPLDAAIVPGICQAHGKHSTGSATDCLILAQDKWKTKAVLTTAGVDCPWGKLVAIGESVSAGSLPSGRCIVKPNLGDASEGIDTRSVTDGSSAEVQRAVRRIHEQFAQPALIEGLVGHRELNVSLYERDGHVEILPIAEIDFSAFRPDSPRIVGYAAKWLSHSFEYGNTPRIIPAPLEAAIAASVSAAALTAWRVLGCSGYARVDMRLDGQQRLVVLEVNPNPDISPEAGFAAALKSAGVAYDDLVTNLVACAAGPRPQRIVTFTPPAAVRREALVDLRMRDARPADVTPILALLEKTGRFRANELAVAGSVLDESFREGGSEAYRSFVAQNSSTVVGWICFGPTPCTENTFEIDWLAVSPEWQRRKVGATLLQCAEGCMQKMGAKMIVVQTSARKDYLSARQFYLKHGYREASRVPDFYALGDDMVIYFKTLTEALSTTELSHNETPNVLAT